MAVRPSWEGHLRLSLVTCPVSLFAATSEAQTVRFNLINPATNNRIKMKTVDAGTGEELSRSDLVKGFEVAKNQYVLLDKQDLESVKVESTHVIDIEEFVPAKSIDRLYWDTPYHLLPSGKTGVEAYSVIRAAMEKRAMVAIGRLVLSTRERICALEPRANEIVLTTLRTNEEVRHLQEVGGSDLPKPDPRMLEIAEKIVDQQKAEFDPWAFVDRYEEALRDMIERKKKGAPLTLASDKGVDDTKVIDLMAALKKSLENQSRPAKTNTNRKKAGNRRAA